KKDLRNSPCRHLHPLSCVRSCHINNAHTSSLLIIPMSGLHPQHTSMSHLYQYHPHPYSHQYHSGATIIASNVGRGAMMIRSLPHWSPAIPSLAPPHQSHHYYQHHPSHH